MQLAVVLEGKDYLARFTEAIDGQLDPTREHLPQPCNFRSEGRRFSSLGCGISAGTFFGLPVRRFLLASLPFFLSPELARTPC